MPDGAFIDAIKALNGTPAEVFEHPELVELMLPLLRADFELVETYAERPGPRLSCPVTALGGHDDAGVPSRDLAQWRAVTGGPFRSVLFKGDHFYINTARAEVHEAGVAVVQAAGVAEGLKARGAVAHDAAELSG